MRDISGSPVPLVTTQDYGKGIRAERKMRGWTQQQLAQKAGLSRQTIVDLEKGRNVSLFAFHKALITLGKGLYIRDIGRLDLDRIADFFPDED